MDNKWLTLCLTLVLATALILVMVGGKSSAEVAGLLTGISLAVDRLRK